MTKKLLDQCLRQDRHCRICERAESQLISSHRSEEWQYAIDDVLVFQRWPCQDPPPNIIWAEAVHEKRTKTRCLSCHGRR